MNGTLVVGKLVGSHQYVSFELRDSVRGHQIVPKAQIAEQSTESSGRF